MEKEILRKLAPASRPSAIASCITSSRTAKGNASWPVIDAVGQGGIAHHCLPQQRSWLVGAEIVLIKLRYNACVLSGEAVLLVLSSVRQLHKLANFGNGKTHGRVVAV